MRHFPSMTLLLAVLAVSGAASAEIYRWVDANGRVQYSDQPPPGVKADKVTSSPASGAAGGAAKSSQDQEQESRKRKTQEEEKSKKQAKADEAARLQEKNCAQAKANLALFERGGRITRMNEKGEATLLSDAEIAAGAAEARRAIAEWCK